MFLTVTTFALQSRALRSMTFSVEPVLNEVNQVVAAGKVLAGDVEVPLEFFLVSDYKVLHDVCFNRNY